MVVRGTTWPAMNLRSKRCQIPRCSAPESVGSPRHAMWVGRSPAEFVTNGRSTPRGSHQSSQRSVCCWDVQDSAVGMGQSSQEPSRVRHVVSLLGAAAFLAMTKPPRLQVVFSREQTSSRSHVAVRLPSLSARLSVDDSMTMSSRSREG